MSSLTNLYKQTKYALEGGRINKRHINNLANTYSNPFKSLDTDTVGFSHRDLETTTLSDITIDPLAGGVRDQINKYPSRDRYTKYEFAFKKTVNKGLPKDNENKEGGAYQYSSVSENDLNALRNIILSDNQSGGGCGCEGEQTNIKRLNDSATSTMMTAQMGGDFSATSVTQSQKSNQNNTATSTIMTAQMGGVYSATSDSTFNINSQSQTEIISNISNSNDTSVVLSIQEQHLNQLGGNLSVTSPLNDSLSTVEALNNKDVNTLRNIGSHLTQHAGRHLSSSISDFSISVTNSQSNSLTSEDAINYTGLVGGVRKNSKKGKQVKKNKKISRKSAEDETIDDSSSTTVSGSVSDTSGDRSSSSRSSSVGLGREVLSKSESNNQTLTQSFTDSQSSNQSSNQSSKSVESTEVTESNNSSSSTTESATFTNSQTPSSSQSQSSSQSSNTLGRMTQTTSSKSTRSSAMSDSGSSVSSSTSHSSSSSMRDSSSYTSKSGNSSSSENETRIGSYRQLQRNYPTSSVDSNSYNSDNSNNVVDVKQFYSSDRDDGNSLYNESETNFLRNNLSKNRFK